MRETYRVRIVQHLTCSCCVDFGYVYVVAHSPTQAMEQVALLGLSPIDNHPDEAEQLRMNVPYWDKDS